MAMEWAGLPQGPAVWGPVALILSQDPCPAPQQFLA